MVAIAALVVAGVLFASGGTAEHFGVPEFIDRSQYNRTTATAGSSYAQQTNHLRAPDAHEPPRGPATGHRVGQWEGHTGLFW